MKRSLMQQAGILAPIVCLSIFQFACSGNKDNSQFSDSQQDKNVVTSADFEEVLTGLDPSIKQEAVNSMLSSTPLDFYYETLTAIQETVGDEEVEVDGITIWDLQTNLEAAIETLESSEEASLVTFEEILEDSGLNTATLIQDAELEEEQGPSLLEDYENFLITGEYEQGDYVSEDFNDQEFGLTAFFGMFRVRWQPASVVNAATAVNTYNRYTQNSAAVSSATANAGPYQVFDASGDSLGMGRFNADGSSIWLNRDIINGGASTSSFVSSPLPAQTISSANARTVTVPASEWDAMKTTVAQHTRQINDLSSLFSQMQTNQRQTADILSNIASTLSANRQTAAVKAAVATVPAVKPATAEVKKGESKAGGSTTGDKTCVTVVVDGVTKQEGNNC